MATMIPSQIGDDAPRGEIAVFEALQSNADMHDWLIFHGLPIARHSRVKSPVVV